MEHTFYYLFEERKSFMRNLTSFIKSKECSSLNSLTISINADWGYGKTFFLDVLKERFSTHTILTYNAWKCDYEKDALISIMNELVEQMLPNNDSIQEKANKFCANFLGITSSIIKNIQIPFLGSIEDILNTARQDRSQIESDLNPLNNTKWQASDSKSVIGAFHKALAYYRNEILQEYQNQYVIVLIDELDRCSPPFAIDVLEKIKHFFAIDGYCFIFMNNKESLGASIRHFFGIEDIDNYLKRFFDFELKLPLPDYTEFLEMKYLEDTESEVTALTVFKDMLKSYQPAQSLRSIEKMCDIFDFLYRELPKGETEFELAIEKFIIPFIVIIGTLEEEAEDLIKNCNWIKYYEVKQKIGSNNFHYYLEAKNHIELKDRNMFINRLFIKGKYTNIKIPISDTKFNSNSFDTITNRERYTTNIDERILSIYFDDICLGNSTFGIQSGGNDEYYIVLPDISRLYKFYYEKYRFIASK